MLLEVYVHLDRDGGIQPRGMAISAWLNAKYLSIVRLLPLMKVFCCLTTYKTSFLKGCSLSPVGLFFYGSDGLGCLTRRPP